ncbi:ubiquitin fusion degradation protein UFD1-domain-containing protein [Lipomyces oligophaga]|uniref:ubiquitin fusion degradation protein UFD1-domain-containing protein n=1 Tax=Lipomyces oligophaga TaxID=45792 RepID=UPI0034D00F20
MQFGGFYDDNDNDVPMGGAPFHPSMMSRFGFPNRMEPFKEYFRCYPVAMLPGPVRESLNYGGKIILPPSALNKLTRLNISYPMLFELSNEELELTTHAGVLEFIAEEGRVYLPQWMMERLALQPGSLVVVASTRLPMGSFVKIEPQSPDFLDISDPKAVLENALRNFTTLTIDDIFEIKYNNKVYQIKVLEIKPTQKSGISVVETDLEVDFAPPVGYVEPSAAKSAANTHSGTMIHTPDGQSMADIIGYADLVSASQSGRSTPALPFAAPAGFGGGGAGHRLSNKKGSSKRSSASSRPSTSATSSPLSATPPPTSVPSLADAMSKGSQFAITGKDKQDEDRAIPKPLRLPFGQLFFGYPVVPVKKASA